MTVGLSPEMRALAHRVRYEPTPRRTRSLKATPGTRSIGSTRGNRGENIAWSYEQPLQDAMQLTDLIAFYGERTTINVDGRTARPGR